MTFPLVHDALADIEPFAYLLLRFSIAELGPGRDRLSRREVVEPHPF